MDTVLIEDKEYTVSDVLSYIELMYKVRELSEGAYQYLKDEAESLPSFEYRDTLTEVFYWIEAVKFSTGFWSELHDKLTQS